MCASIQIFLIAALMVQSGLAIRCFNCDSESNALCANMTDPNLVAEECNFDRLVQIEYNSKNRHNQYHNQYYNQPPQHRHWLHQLSDISERKLKNEFDAKFVCQKLVGIDEKKQVTIVRRCQIANELPCNFSRALTVNINRHVDCYLCDEDGCNGSTHNSVFGALMAFGAAVAVFKHFIF